MVWTGIAESTLVLYLRLVTQEWINSNDFFSNPHALSLAISKLWSIPSNALEISIKSVPVSPPSSRFLCHSSTIVRRQCCAFKSFRNPHWNLKNTESKYGKTWLCIIYVCMYMWCVARFGSICAFVQFRKRKKHPWRSVTFSKVAGF